MPGSLESENGCRSGSVEKSQGFLEDPGVIRAESK